MGRGGKMESMSERSETEPTLHDVMDVLHSMSGRLDSMDDRLDSIDHRVGNLEVDMIEVKESLVGIERAIDKDAVTPLDHEARLTRLET